jgi:GT2 family glycosyltransferase
MSLSIIIVTYNSGHVIDDCISSLGRLRNCVLVVDNNSLDDTVIRAKRCGASVVQNEVNLGYGRAANRGARDASGQILCFLNPDCQTTPHFLSQGILALEGHPKRCVVPRVIRHHDMVTDGRQFGYTRRKLFCDMIETNCGKNSITKWLKKHDQFHDTTWTWPVGTCILIHKAFFLGLNGFDERYFMYCEDVDIGYRIFDAGGEIYSINCDVTHTIQDSSRIPRMHKIGLLNNGRILYGTLYYGQVFGSSLRVVVKVCQLFKFGRTLYRGLLG